MRILFIPTTYGFSKPISGGQNRFSNLLKELKNKGNDVILLESDLMIDNKDKLISKVYSYADYKFKGRVLTIFRDLNIHFISQIYYILKNEDVDLIQITHPSGVIAIRFISFLTRSKVSIVYDAHNIESKFISETYLSSSKHSRIDYILVKIYTEILERYISKYLVDHITSVSDLDTQYFINSYKVSSNKITCIPSGSHIRKLPNSKVKSSIREKLGIDDNIVIFFHGLYSHSPNRDAFEIIMNYIAPKFEQLDENVIFVLGGSGSPQFDQKNIKSLGFIDALYETISISDIAIVPLSKGAGTKLKIFDYLSMGLPIVTTKKGAEGIDIVDMENAMIVNSVNEEFINSIKYLVDNKLERKRIGLNAQKLAENEYDWKKIGSKLNQTYKSVLEQNINS